MSMALRGGSSCDPGDVRNGCDNVDSCGVGGNGDIGGSALEGSGSDDDGCADAEPMVRDESICVSVLRRETDISKNGSCAGGQSKTQLAVANPSPPSVEGLLSHSKTRGGAQLGRLAATGPSCRHGADVRATRPRDK